MTTFSNESKGESVAMHFDGTVQLGSLLEVASVLGAAFMLYGRFSSMETKIDAVWRWYTREVEDRRTHDRRGGE